MQRRVGSSAGLRKACRGGGVASKKAAAADRSSRCTLLSLVPRLVLNIAGAASLGIRGKRVAWRGLTYPGLPCRQRDAVSSEEMLFEGWSRVGYNTWLLEAVYVGSMFQRWWRSELLRPVVDAGATPAGFSRAVVQRNRTTTLYTRVERSPFEAWFQRCCSSLEALQAVSPKTLPVVKIRATSTVKRRPLRVSILESPVPRHK